MTEAKAAICLLPTKALDAGEYAVNALSSKTAGNTEN